MPKNTVKNKRELAIGLGVGVGIVGALLSKGLMDSVLPGLALGAVAALLVLFKLRSRRDGTE